MNRNEKKSIQGYFHHRVSCSVLVCDCVRVGVVQVMLRTARLVAQWQSVGFCHGVLNTDNMSILGLTLDYGPEGCMDRSDKPLWLHFN